MASQASATLLLALTFAATGARPTAVTAQRLCGPDGESEPRGDLRIYDNETQSGTIAIREFRDDKGRPFLDAYYSLSGNAPARKNWPLHLAATPNRGRPVQIRLALTFFDVQDRKATTYVGVLPLHETSRLPQRFHLADGPIRSKSPQIPSEPASRIRTLRHESLVGLSGRGLGDGSRRGLRQSSAWSLHGDGGGLRD